MQQRAFGGTGVSVGEIGFGAWAIGGPAEIGGRQVGWGEVSDEDSLRAIRRAFRLGVTFFDTADVYGLGHSEELLGAELHRERDGVFFATKGGNVRRPDGSHAKDFSLAHLESALDGSLRRLRTDHVDLYQLHNPTPEDIERGEIFGVLDRLKTSGKTRFVGISLSKPEDGLAVLARAHIDAIQVVYNALSQRAARELFPAAERAGVAIIARVPLAWGLLAGRYAARHVFAADDHRSHLFPPDRMAEISKHVEDFRTIVHGVSDRPAQAALRFVLADPRVAVVIPGAKTAIQVEENVSATFAPLPPKVVAEISLRFRDVNL
ncbi:MAG: aldo/keto reductase [Planctomycetes bacterium]|nr:aldo/keto reductase [Planctomycetota bacterium]MBI3845381.1 aldo/keto reductase [Planctomycetota bacterium]